MIKGVDYTLVIKLDQTGLVDTDVAVFVKKPSDTTFVAYAITATEWDEVADNYYNIAIPKTLTDENGTYIFKVTVTPGGPTDFFEQRENEPQPLTSSPAPNVCLVTGNIIDATGTANPFENVDVSAHPLLLPAEISANFVMGRKIFTRTDHSGYFSLPLIQGMTVLIEVKSAGIRFQAVIPSQSTIRIEDLMP